jgi:hypothetical protein
LSHELNVPSGLLFEIIEMKSKINFAHFDGGVAEKEYYEIITSINLSPYFRPDQYHYFH